MLFLAQLQIISSCLLGGSFVLRVITKYIFFLTILFMCLLSPFIFWWIKCKREAVHLYFTSCQLYNRPLTKHFSSVSWFRRVTVASVFLRCHWNRRFKTAAREHESWTPLRFECFHFWQVGLCCYYPAPLSIVRTGLTQSGPIPPHHVACMVRVSAQTNTIMYTKKLTRMHTDAHRVSGLWLQNHSPLI